MTITTHATIYGYMIRDDRLHITLHILDHLAETGAYPTTAEELADHFHTHLVVIRRAVARLCETGIVGSVKGHGGGWALAHPATAISLGMVYGRSASASRSRRGGSRSPPAP